VDEAAFGLSEKEDHENDARDGRAASS
jgi:hypothetical protein